MIRRIAEIKALPGLRLQVSFDDGKVVLYDVGEDARQLPAFGPLLSEYGLFPQARLDESRTCVYWSDQIDLPSDAIYDYGREVRRPQESAAAHR